MFQNEVRGVFVRLSVLVRIYPQYQKDFLILNKVTVKWSSIMKKLTTLLLAAVLTSGLFAQNLTGKISGTVTSDGEALVGANVILEGTTSGAATDVD